MRICPSEYTRLRRSFKKLLGAETALQVSETSSHLQLTDPQASIKSQLAPCKLQLLHAQILRVHATSSHHGLTASASRYLTSSVG